MLKTIKKIFALLLACSLILSIIPVVSFAETDEIYSCNFEYEELNSLPTGYASVIDAAASNKNFYGVADDVLKDGSANKSLKHTLKADAKTNSHVIKDLGTNNTGKIVFRAKVYFKNDDYTKALFLLNGTDTLVANCVISLYFGANSTIIRQYSSAGSAVDTTLNVTFPDNTWTDVEINLDTNGRKATVTINDVTSDEITLNAKTDPLSLRAFATYMYYRRVHASASSVYIDDIYIGKESEAGVNKAPVYSSDLYSLDAGTEYNLDNMFTDTDELTYAAEKGLVNGNIYKFDTESNGIYKDKITATDIYGLSVTKEFFIKSGSESQIMYYEDFDSLDAGTSPEDYVFDEGVLPNDKSKMEVSNDYSVSGTNALKHTFKADGKAENKILYEFEDEYTGNVVFNTKLYTKRDGYTKAIFLLDGTDSFSTNCVMALYIDDSATAGKSKLVARQYVTASRVKDVTLSDEISDNKWTDISISINTDKKSALISIDGKKPSEVILDARTGRDLKINSFGTYIYYRRINTATSYMYFDDIAVYEQDKITDITVENPVTTWDAEIGVETEIDISEFFKSKYPFVIQTDVGEITDGVWTYTPDTVGTKNITFSAINSIGGRLETKMELNVSGNVSPCVTREIPDKYIVLGDSVIVDLSGYITDDNGDVLTFTSNAGVIEGNIFTYTPTAKGEEIINITGSDGKYSVSDAFRIITNIPSDDQAVIYYQDFETVTEGGFPTEFTVTYDDTFNVSTGNIGVKTNGDNEFDITHVTSGKASVSAVATMPSAYQGSYKLELDAIFKSLLIRRDIIVYNHKGTELLSLRVDSDSDILTVVTNGVVEKCNMDPLVSGKEYKVEVYVHEDSKSFDLYIDGNIVFIKNFSNIDEADIGIGSLGILSYYRRATNNTNGFVVDNIKVTGDLAVTQEDIDAVNSDWNNLIWSRMSAQPQDGVTEHLKLTLKGAKGSTITYESSKPHIISESGMVMPLQDRDEQVMLKATLRKGNAVLTKTFDITVLKSEISEFETVILMDFEDIKEGEMPSGWVESMSGPQHKETYLVVESDGDGNKYLKSNNTHLDEQTYPGYTTYYYLDNAVNGLIKIEYDQYADLTTSENKIIFYNSKGQQIFNVGTQSNFAYTVNGVVTNVNTINFVPGTWCHYEIILDTSTGHAMWYINGKYLTSFKATENISSNYSLGQFAIYNRIRAAGVNTMLLDNFKVSVNTTSKLDKLLNSVSYDSYNVIKDFSLITPDSEDVAFKWISEDANAIEIDGNIAKVKRSDSDKKVILTLEASYNNSVRQRNFEFTVLKNVDDATAVAQDLEYLTFDKLSDESVYAVTKSFTLATQGEEKSNISYLSDSDNLIINQDVATVIRGNSDETVNLTVTVTRGNVTDSKTLTLRIIRNAGDNLFENKGFAYCSGETIKNPSSNINDGNFNTVYEGLMSDHKPVITIDSAVKQSVDKLWVSGAKNVKSFKLYTSIDSITYNYVGEYKVDIADNDIVINEYALNSISARYFKFEFIPLTEGNIGVREIQLYNTALTDEQSVEYAHKLLDIKGNGVTDKDLSLPLYGSHGTRIVWSTSDSSVIDENGVIHPGDSNKKATLTAKIYKNDVILTKDFEITVLKDGVPAPRDTEDFKKFTEDVSGMSDEDFFGVWDESIGDFRYDKQPKLKYDYNEELKIVGEYVKKGDYESAKSELAHYYRTKDSNYPYQSTSRQYKEADLIANDILFSSSSTYLGEFTVPENEGEIEVDISNYVKGRGTYTFFTVQKYKSQPESYFYTKEAFGGKYAAKITIVADGVERTYTVSEDTYVAPGINMDTSYGNEDKMYTKETADYESSEQFSALWTKDTKRAYLQFRLTGLDEETKITSAKITLYGKSEGEDNVITLWRSGNNSWEENNFSWRDALTQVFSYNGADPDWIMPQNTQEGADNAARMDIARVTWMGTLTGCYKTTNDEYYAYHSIRQTLNMIANTQDSVDFFNLQDLGIRAGTLVLSFDQLRTSPHMSDAAMISYIKNLWLLNESCTYPANFTAAHNHGIFSNRGNMRITMYFPEFTDYEENLELVIDRWNQLANALIADNGSYFEGTSTYTQLTLSRLLTALTEADEFGFELDSDYANKLEKLAEYFANMLYPDGSDPQYGDATFSNHFATVKEVAEYTDSDTLRYIATNGKEGVKPDYTSKYFDGYNRYLTLRDGFTEDSMMMSTNMSYGDGKSHTHFDNLSLVMYAYDNVLLTDNGHYTYSENEISNWLKQTTESHNTVSVNDINQGLFADTLNYLVLNDKFDYFAATSTATRDQSGSYKHKRTITFPKGKFFIVTDMITPPNSSVNSYNQNWHLRPEANPSYNNEEGYLTTNFEQGGNLIISQVDKDVSSLTLKNGYYSSDNFVVAESKYASYNQTKSGIAYFDTVFYPKPEGDKSTIKTERIDLGVDNTVATAFYIDIINGDSVTRNLYYQSYETTPSKRKIDNLSFDGRVLMVEYRQNGEISAVSMVGGKELTLVSENGESTIIKNSSEISDVFTDYNFDTLELHSETVDMNNVAGMQIYAPSNIAKVKLNNSELTFARDNNLLTLGQNETLGTDKISVSPVPETVNGRPYIYSVGTTTQDYITTVTYRYNNMDYVATLKIPAGSYLKGKSDWDGTLPSICYSGTGNRNVQGTIKGYLYTYPDSIISDKDFELTVQLGSGIKHSCYGSNSVVEPEKVQDGIIIKNKGDIDVTLYEAYLTPPTGGGSASGGGGSASGGGGNTQGSTDVDTPDTPDIPYVPGAERFEDIKNHWAYNYIDQMVKSGWINGITDTKFAPDNFITRAEFAAIIKRVLNLSDSQCEMKDVSENSWYYKEVGAVVNAGIMKGYDGNFRPDDKITREEIAVTLVNIYESRLEPLDTDVNVIEKFEDKDNISLWAYSYIAKALKLGIIQGMTENTVVPRDNATRAQGVVMILRLYDIMQK